MKSQAITPKYNIAAIEAEAVQFIELNSYNKKLYDKNTDINAHHENLTLLALLGNSDILLQAAQEYCKELERAGHLTEELRKFEQALTSKLKVKSKEKEDLAPYGIGLAAMILSANFYGYCEDIELAHKHILGERIQPIFIGNFEKTALAARDKILKADLAKPATEMAGHILNFYRDKAVLDYPIEFKDSKWVIDFGKSNAIYCDTLTEAIAIIIGISL